MTEIETTPFDALAFRAALGRYATGVVVVVAQGAQGPVAITANSFASLSLDPPLVLWSPAKSSKRHDAFCTALEFLIFVLGAGQEHVARTCAAPACTFDTPDWHLPETGPPRLRDAAARFECHQHAVLDGGDHSIVVGRVVAFQKSGLSPLLFHDGQYLPLP